MLAVQVTLEWTGDTDKFERAAKRVRNPRELMKQIGIVGMRGSFERLRKSLDAGGIKTARLAGSLNVAADGGGGTTNTIFDLQKERVVIGSNLPYAAQKNFGGRIEPRPPNKALAIPLTDSLKRSGIGPRGIDPSGDSLAFVPIVGGASGNVFGLLVVDDDDFGGNRQGTALFALARYVDQEPSLFMGWDGGDVQVIETDVWPKFLVA